MPQDTIAIFAFKIFNEKRGDCVAQEKLILSLSLTVSYLLI